MRSSRPLSLVSGLSIVALFAAALSPAAAHAATGTNAFFSESLWDGGIPRVDDVLRDAAEGATVTVTGTVSTTVTMEATPAGTYPYKAFLRAPSGQQLTANTDYTTSAVANTTGGYFALSPAPAGASCTGVNGEMHVGELTAAADGTVTTLAVTYRQRCGTGAWTTWGELRYAATTPYAAPLTTPSSRLDFGDRLIGSTTTLPVTLTVHGSRAVTFGTPSKVGDYSAPFTVVDDACAGHTVAPGGSCSVDVSFAPTASSYVTGKLVYPTDLPYGERVVALGGHGADPPSAPNSMSALPGDDGVGLSWTAPDSNGGGTISGYRVYADDGSGMRAISPDLPVSTTKYADPLPPGTTRSYRVAAINGAGPGTPSATVTATVLQPLAAAGSVTALTMDAEPGATRPDAASSVLTPTVLEVGPQYFVLDATAANATPVRMTLSTTDGGRRLTAGEYDVNNGTGPSLSVSNTAMCNGPGHLSLSDVDLHADGSPDVVTGSYRLSCGTHDAAGEIRWRSAQPYVAAGVTPPAVHAGGVRVGGHGTPMTVTVANTGTAPLTLGAAATSGDTSDFGVSNDGCSGRTLSPASSCTLSVTFTPTAQGTRTAMLDLPDSTRLGYRDIVLDGTGAVPPSAPGASSVQAVAGRVHLTWSPPTSDGGSAVTGFAVYRGTSATTLTKLASVGPITFEYDDRTTTGGTAYYYAVAAANATGEGSQNEPSSVNAVDSDLVFSADSTAGYGVYGLYVGAPDGPAKLPLVVDGHQNVEPSVSPDGTLVAYSSDRNGTFHIWVTRTDGTGTPRQVTSGSSNDHDPSWSPDGKRIAFDREVSSTSADVWTVNADGSYAAAVNGGAGAERPSWTPSGRELVVGSLRTMPPTVDVVALDGPARRTVAGTTGGVQPQVSPDGTSIVFTHVDGTATDACGVGYPVTSIATVPFVGGTATTLMQSSGARWLDDASWWPDGTRVSFDNLVKDAYGCLDHSVIDTVSSAGGLQSVRAGGDEAYPAAHLVHPAARPVTPPHPVGSVAGVVAPTQVTLSWALPSDADLWRVVVRRSAPGAGAPSNPEDGYAVYDGRGTSARATGLVAGKTYAFSIFTIDTAGSAGTSVVRKAVTLATPSVSAPAVSAVTTTALPFAVSWRANGITPASYDVAYAPRPGSAATWATATRVTSGTFGASGRPRTVTPGSAWSFTVRGRDAYGNVTGWSGAAVTQVPIDDRSTSTRWSSGWSAYSSSSRWLGTGRYATGAGRSVTMSLTGTSFRVVGARGTGNGQFKVYVDGRYVTTVDTRASVAQVRQVLWSSASYASGRHTLTVVIVGTRGRPRVDLDGFVAVH